MSPEQVGASYDQIASRWQRADFPASNGIAHHKRAIAFTRQQARALDVGCGCNGRIDALLLEHGFAVTGIDISEQMLMLATARLPEVQYEEADITRWTPDQTYDLITGWDSIWHVPLAEQEAVLRKLMGALNPGGVLIFTAGGTNEPEEKHDAAMGVPMYHASLGIPKMLAVIDNAGCVCRHLEFDQHPEQHLVVIAQRR